jgi:hypothetical protein
MQAEFDTFWQAFPRKTAKKAAFKAYQQIRREISAECILASVAIMKETEWKGRKLQYLPYPATFLRAEAFEERTEALEDEREERIEGTHICVICRPSHQWHHSGPCGIDCAGSEVVTCPEQIALMRAAIKV